MQDKTSYNNKNQPHGYWEMYWFESDTLWFKGHVLKNMLYGYQVRNNDNDENYVKSYYAR